MSSVLNVSHPNLDCVRFTGSKCVFCDFECACDCAPCADGVCCGDEGCPVTMSDEMHFALYGGE